MMQISSNGIASAQGSNAENTAQSTKEDLHGETSSQTQAGDKNSFTPRTSSQRQASRSFKQPSDQHSDSVTGTLTNLNNNRDLEDSQFSIEELSVRQQKNSDKTNPTGTGGGSAYQNKANGNNLFDNSTSREQVSSILSLVSILVAN